MSIKAKFLTAVSIVLMSVASFCAMAQNSMNVALPEGWSATQDNDGKVDLQYSGNKRVKSVKVHYYSQIPHAFSVSATKKVFFSPGNLQYRASTDTWRFAEHQWDYVGNATMGTVYENGVKCDNELIAENYTGWIDLFGWGTGNNPTEINNDADYSTFNDWGECISVDNVWRTLSSEEWKYLFQSRIDAASKYGKATVAGTRGFIFLPDVWILPDNISFSCGINTSYSQNTYTAEQWLQMQNAGAVFFPAAGYRNGISLSALGSDNGSYGNYWSSSADDNNYAFRFVFNNGNMVGTARYQKYCGFSVRLVRDAK